VKQLFWRIFALFWAASVVLILAIAGVTTYNFENERIPGLGITRLESVLNEHLRNAAHVLRDEGIGGLRSKLAQSLDFGRVSIYVLDAGKHDLIGREVPDAVAAADRLLAEALRARERHGRRGTAGTAGAGCGSARTGAAASGAAAGSARHAGGSARRAAGGRCAARARTGAAAGAGRGHPARAPGDPADAGAIAPATPPVAALVGATPSRTSRGHQNCCCHDT